MTSRMPHRTAALALIAVIGSACANGGGPAIDQAYFGPTSNQEDASGTTVGAPRSAAGPDGSLDAASPAATGSDAASDQPGTPGDSALAASQSAAAGEGPAAEAESTPAATDEPTSAASEPGTFDVIGVTDDTIKVVYYWSASQTDNNPFLAAFPESNANEEKMAKVFFEYLNRHADGGATFYGYPFNLHGRKFDLTVVDVGLYNEPEKNRAGAERIAQEIQPFLAISNGGVISMRVCPILADAGIITMGVLSHRLRIHEVTNNYCYPAMATIDKQIEATVNYIANRWQHEPYINELGQEAERVFGITYAEWPEVVDSAPYIAERLRERGVNVAAVAAGGEDLGPQQQQAPSIVAQFRSAGVNTVIFPEAIMPIAFTSAAEAQGYHPDYYVWPCSGEDAVGIPRLYTTSQWERASGLTCFDPNWTSDLVADSKMESSQWWQQYHEVDPGTPAGAAPLVYNYMMPLVVGITEAGRDLTPETFQAALERVDPYRYDYINGPTTDPRFHQVGPFVPGDMSIVQDFTYIEWTNSQQTDNGLVGTYIFPEDGKRYYPGDF